MGSMLTEQRWKDAQYVERVYRSQRWRDDYRSFDEWVKDVLGIHPSTARRWVRWVEVNRMMADVFDRVDGRHAFAAEATNAGIEI